MTLALDLPECPASLVSRRDPRWKLAAALLACGILAFTKTWPVALGGLAAALLLAWLARLPGRWFRGRVGGVLLLMAVFLAWLPFVPRSADDALPLGMLTLSRHGSQLFVVALAKTTSLVTIALVVLATAPLQDTFKAARALRVPGVLVQLLLLTYRYVFLLFDEFSRLRTALRVRGYRNRASLHSYRTIGQVAGTLLVRSHERAERVGQAMRCRGYDGEFRTLHAFQTTRADVLFFVAVVAVAAGLLAVDLLVRWQPLTLP